MTAFERLHCGECGIEFDVPSHFYKDRLQTKAEWFCPNGHSRVFRESSVDRMRRERDSALQQVARLEEEKVQAEKQLKKLERRTAAGTCPCCQRTFQNTSVHMRKQHPDYVANNVVTLKAKK